MGFVPIIALGLPVLELVGIYWVWQGLGAWTLAWLAGAALAGGMLIARERAYFAPRMAQSLFNGSAPLSVLLGSGLRFLAGVLLILPGALSDTVALVLLLFSLGRGTPAPGSGQPPPYVRPGPDDVIEGEYRRMD